MANMNETPSANRLHIGVFGKTNSGKSSFINAFTKQQVSIVADVAGTTTDPVYKPMEIHPLGPCVIIDTAGFDDVTELGELRMEKTRLAAEKTDIAILVISAPEKGGLAVGLSEQEMQENWLASLENEKNWLDYFKEQKKPVLILLSKTDVLKEEESTEYEALIRTQWKCPVVSYSAVTGKGLDAIKEELARLLPENYGNYYITGDLVSEEDLVLLVMPQDIQAPKGRLILPQVQTIRELLDKKCLVTTVTTDKLIPMLDQLKKSPKLIITDSQVFGYVYEHKPKESMLTSFSVLFAAYKGDLPYYIEGARTIDSLTGNSKVLIAECCTHAPLEEDIGRVKIPNMLKKRFGSTLQIDHVSGTDFPQDLTEYDLIIQCGACMFNRTYVLSRIDRARSQKVPMTNYGVVIAHLTGILDKITIVN